MEIADKQRLGDRVGPAVGVALVHGIFACLFLFGLGAEVRQAVVEPLRLINLLPPAPEPEPIILQPPPPPGPPPPMPLPLPLPNPPLPVPGPRTRAAPCDD